MLHYHQKLKHRAQVLREESTHSETKLWQKIRSKQIASVQFYRQKPIGPYIVDFYAPRIALVVEVDGSQHYDPKQQAYDLERDNFLRSKSLKVTRFNNLQVLQELDAVLEIIHDYVQSKLTAKPHHSKHVPPLKKALLHKSGSDY